MRNPHAKAQPGLACPAASAFKALDSWGSRPFFMTCRRDRRERERRSHCAFGGSRRRSGKHFLNRSTPEAVDSCLPAIARPARPELAHDETSRGAISTGIRRPGRIRRRHPMVPRALNESASDPSTAHPVELFVAGGLQRDREPQELGERAGAELGHQARPAHLDDPQGYGRNDQCLIIYNR
jgi:hypothetical protein